MRIVKMTSAAVETYAVKDEHDMLFGLIHKQDDGRWKIELMRKFVHFERTADQAFAWVRGACVVITELEQQANATLTKRRARSTPLMRLEELRRSQHARKA